MKLYKLIYLLCFVVTPFLQGDLNNSIKVRAAAFYPAHNRVRSIYGQVIPSYQVEGGFQFNRYTQVWLNVDWMHRKGNSEHLKYFTSLNVMSYSGGVSLVGYLCRNVKVYLGVGYSCSCVKMHNRMACKHRSQRRYLSGVQSKFGVIFPIYCRFFGEVFADYLYQPLQFKTHTSLSGVKVGAGLGYYF